jgi:hypothetical protein
MSLGAMQHMLKCSNLIAQNIEAVNQKAIEDQMPKMIRANWDQLDQGKTNKDEPITPFYAPSTAKRKGFNIPNLKETGDWRESFDIDLRGDVFVWGASDYKDPLLRDKYGNDLQGLNEDNADKQFLVINTKRNNYVERITKRYY